MYIKEEQTTQWPQKTKGEIKIRISKNKQHNDQKKNSDENYLSRIRINCIFLLL
jgi:hypothetical protein